MINFQVNLIIFFLCSLYFMSQDYVHMNPGVFSARKFFFFFFFSFNFGHVANFLIVLNTQKLNNVGVFFVCFLAVLYSMQDLSSWPRDRTWAFCTGSMESLSLDHQAGLVFTVSESEVLNSNRASTVLALCLGCFELCVGESLL